MQSIESQAIWMDADKQYQGDIPLIYQPQWSASLKTQLKSVENMGVCALFATVIRQLYAA
jgi:hypothetical protein